MPEFLARHDFKRFPFAVVRIGSASVEIAGLEDYKPAERLYDQWESKWKRDPFSIAQLRIYETGKLIAFQSIPPRQEENLQ